MAIDREEARAKIAELVGKLGVRIQGKALAILDFNSVDLSEYDNDYRLAKFCIHAAQKRCENDYRPMASEDRSLMEDFIIKGEST